MSQIIDRPPRVTRRGVDALGRGPALVTAAALLALCWPLACASSEVRPEREIPVHGATTPTPRHERWIGFHQALNELARRGEPDMVFLGDSITYGWTVEGLEVWNAFYGHRRAANLGIGGDRTEHVLWRVENGTFEGLTPRLIVLQVGTNNLVQKGEAAPNTPREIADGIAAIVRALRRQLPATRILVLGVFPRSRATPERPRRQAIAATNALLPELADGDSVVYLDVGAIFLQADGRVSAEAMADYLHLTPHGYRLWAEAIEDTVAKLLGE